MDFADKKWRFSDTCAIICKTPIFYGGSYGDSRVWTDVSGNHLYSLSGQRLRSGYRCGEQLGFTKPSVSRAMSILKKDGYVNVDADGAITLTETGLAHCKDDVHPPYSVEPDADGTGCGREDRDRGRLPD